MPFIGSHTHPILKKLFSYQVEYFASEGVARWHATITHGGVLVDELKHMTVPFSASTNAPAAIVAVITKHIDEGDYSTTRTSFRNKSSAAMPGAVSPPRDPST